MALADKVFLGIFVAILIAIGFSILAMQKSLEERMARVTVGGTTITVEVADSPSEHMVGLSNRHSLPQDSGMLFVFPSEGMWEFWMKDTYIPLDILWANASGTIVTIVKNATPNDPKITYISDLPARYVLEVNAGFFDAHGVAEGQQIVVQ